MVEEAEQLHTIKEVAQQLGLGDAMTRRYASALETVSGEQLIVDRRDGRLFTSEQLDVLVKARALVQQTSADVETAIRRALEQPDSLAEITLPQGSALSIERLTAAFTEAQRTANEPLLEALRSIDGKLETLTSQNVRPSEAEINTMFPEAERKPISLGSEPQGTQHGPLVRLAMRLERIFRR